MDKIIGYILLTVAVISFVIIALQTLADDIWYDEVFSMGFIEHSYRDIVRLTSSDVHPPFYYFFLKAVTSVICGIFPHVSIVVAAKITSLLPWFFTFAIAVSYVRAHYGYVTMGFFMVLVTMMPQLNNYYVEIRMYGLAGFLVTSCFLLIVSILKDGSKLYKWALLFISGIATAYTQYYACIAIVSLYITFGIILLYRKSRQIIWLLTISVMSVISFLPWMSVLLTQFTTVRAGYWIQPLTLRSIAGCVKFLVQPVTVNGTVNMVAAGLILLGLGAIIVSRIRSIREKIVEIVFGFAPIVLIILVGFVMSIAGMPVFVYRYMIPAAGCAYLCIAMMISGIDIVTGVSIVSITVGCMFSMKGFYDEEHKKVMMCNEAMEAINEIPKGACIITNFDHVTAITGYYRRDCDVYLYENDADKLLNEMFGRCGRSITSDDVSNLIEEYPQVYFLGSFNSRDDIVNEWEQAGIHSTQEGSYLIERYWFNMYRLEERNE